MNNLMLITYAIFWKHDLVLIMGQTSGVFVYVRNLMLLNREKRQLQGLLASEKTTSS